MQTIHSQKASNYDQVPYESLSFPLSHPDRLATLGKLFGLTSPSLKQARVLELGCAMGGNLIPLALDYPDAVFVGIDLSSRRVWEGHSLIKKLELKNIELKHMDIMDITADLGMFDYVIAHGVYSWVPQPVQEKILEICSKNLSPDGIAFVNYNTYPGWHQRGTIRDMMLYHTARFSDASAKAVQARALLDFLSKSASDNNAYSMLLKTELDILSKQNDTYLSNDLLEDQNEPVYFHQFAEKAKSHGLQYLSESEFATMLTTNFAPEVGDILRRISDDIVRTEQYMDFVRNRSFRQTLLCHQDKVLNRNLDWKNMLDFKIASPTRTMAAREELVNANPVEFVLPNGVTLTISHPLIKTAFDHLAQIWPRSVAFDELLSAASSNPATVAGLTKEQQQQLLGFDLLTAYSAGAIVLRTEEPHLVTDVSPKPMVTGLARHQASAGQRITNQLHEAIEADIFLRNIIVLLDGNRDVTAVTAEIEKLARRNVISVAKGGRQITGGAELTRTITAAVAESLKLIARSALLIA